MINSYFDLGSFDDPIKTYLTQKFYYTYEEGVFTQTEIFLKENRIDNLDDYTLIEGKHKKKFYAVGHEKSDKYNEDTTQFSRISLILDPETETFSREVFHVMDILGNIGGIFSLLRALAAIVVGVYASRLYTNSVIAKLYTFDVDDVYKDDDSKQHEETKRDLIPKEENIYELEHQSSKKEDKKGESEDFEGGEKQNDHIIPQFTNTISSKQGRMLLEKMNKRRRFGYTTLDTLYGLFCCYKKKTW